jgi:hypothetical protein
MGGGSGGTCCGGSKGERGGHFFRGECAKSYAAGRAAADALAAANAEAEVKYYCELGVSTLALRCSDTSAFSEFSPRL